MTAQQLQDFLHRCIPATAALHIRVVSCGADGVTLLMPHAPNRMGALPRNAGSARQGQNQFGGERFFGRRIGGGMGGAVCGFGSLKIQNGNPIKRISALLQSPNAKRRCKIITAAFFYAQAF